MRETVKLVGAKDFHKELEKTVHKTLGFNEMVTLKIADSPSFLRARFSKMEELIYYVNNDMIFHDEKKKIIPLISVVTITDDHVMKFSAAKKKYAKKKKGR